LGYGLYTLKLSKCPVVNTYLQYGPPAIDVISVSRLSIRRRVNENKAWFLLRNLKFTLIFVRKMNMKHKTLSESFLNRNCRSVVL